ncbi:hypothetical protein VTL71DRAFT_7542 [Oculimacula yallundae]|uniref:Uncharacterized protein n=1 Tax=Oculimacula yallundae TaxID=86028 RepID=A0ABR4BUG6_9HELO
MADSSISQSGAQSAPSALPEVSWQTLFWIITTLALNCMTQPCGRVCNTNSQFRIYARSSPFICVLDIGYFFADWAYTRYNSDDSIVKAFHAVTAKRFSDSSRPEGIQALGSSMGTRWLLFILGPLPQAIRLASFKNVYWSKLFGFCFLISWLLVELLILIVACSHYGVPPQVVQSSALMSDERLIKALMLIYFYHILYGQSVCTFWVVHSKLQVSVDRRGLMAHMAVIFGSFVVLIMMYRVLDAILSKNLLLAKNLLVTFEGQNPTGPQVDGSSLILLILFLVNVVTCILGYSLHYDPVGTTNPGWTAAFG